RQPVVTVTQRSSELSMDTEITKYLNRYHALALTGSPMTLEQVGALERHLGLQLPAAYRAYLLIAGMYPPPRLVGSDCHGPYLYGLRKGADELLQESGSKFTLPVDAVVFLLHQGYQFFYFQ